MGEHSDAAPSNIFGNRVPGADTKLVFALTDPALPATDDFAAWARAAGDGEGVLRAEIERLDAEIQGQHTSTPVRFSAFASLWCAPGRSESLIAHAPSTANWYRVHERLAFDRSARPDQPRPWAGVKKTTPWVAVSAVDARIWQGRYANHGQLARSFHATTVRYRQNIVVDTNDDSVDAISELWWTNTEDLLERFVAPGEAAELLAVDVGGFVDSTRASPTVTRHEVLRITQPDC
jgi:hypothetical protein